jgi:uncharacterized protein YecE (DUF72 family)
VSARLFGIRGWQRLEDFYPPRTKPAEMLAHYAEVADLVEAENTFSGIPKPERLADWVRQSPDGFKFDVVAFGGLTLYQRRPGRADLKARLSWTEIAVEPPDVLFEDFRASVAPLIDADRLGCVLLQFPPWFQAGEASDEYLAKLRRNLADLPLAVEFRHPTWELPGQRDATQELLIDLGMGLIVADFPADDPDWVPPIVAATRDDLAVVRLHGHNDAAWGHTHTSPVEPVQYTYTDDDLAPWIERVRALEREVPQVHVLIGTAPLAAALDAAHRLDAAIQVAEEAEARWGYVPEQS